MLVRLSSLAFSFLQLSACTYKSGLWCLDHPGSIFLFFWYLISSWKASLPHSQGAGVDFTVFPPPLRGIWYQPGQWKHHVTVFSSKIANETFARTAGFRPLLHLNLGARKSGTAPASWLSKEGSLCEKRASVNSPALSHDIVWAPESNHTWNPIYSYTFQ